MPRVGRSIVSTRFLAYENELVNGRLRRSTNEGSAPSSCVGEGSRICGGDAATMKRSRCRLATRHTIQLAGEPIPQ